MLGELKRGINEVIQNSWLGNAGNNVINKLSACAKDLTHWSKTHCNKLRVNIESYRNQLSRNCSASGIQDEVQFDNLRKKLNHLFIREDMYWRQREKTHWYHDGDLNTKFFHTAATSIKKVNKILSLETNEGIRITYDSGMRSIAKNYFEELFEGHESVRSPLVNLLDHVIDSEDNDQLKTPFCIEEFKEAMFSMQPDKFSGPDGFNPRFYQHFWSVCRRDIYNECCQRLNEGKFPPTLNSRNIVLIPKGTKQKTMKD